ncbi:hypothetical protein HYPSUDRAFT_61114 [Hypholoma sublateritium FD-334 SS-4]|uniref:MARVEL domain-containing protein n=1 Tax=Hypholoma sublateritium (strain FD-334 SS-4) TaxID=945553 RepID=A0A0D2QFF1_HYPSF|nr:hypothetical protein HYPSUDRAFT_61114 [Hypholoma sublateritium FD-334 SS-4]
MSSAAMHGDSRQTQLASSRARMSLFSIIRSSLYGTVILFTVICLAMAGHFQSVLASSNLTRFVPFAIFVCSVSLLVFLVLLSFSYFLRGRNPISTRIELACLGLAGLFWLVLGVFLVTSDAQDADVECFSSADSETPLDDDLTSFHTDQYQAMYRVLMTFSLFNAVLVLFACFALLFLAIRRHRKGDQHMWYGPVTSCAWFNSYGNTKQTEAKTSSSSILPVATVYMGETVFTEKPERKASARRAERQYPSSSQPYSRPYQPRNPYPTQTKARSPTGAGPTRHGSGSSPRHGSTRVADLENGGMLNPYSRGPARGTPR